MPPTLQHIGSDLPAGVEVILSIILALLLAPSLVKALILLFSPRSSSSKSSRPAPTTRSERPFFSIHVATYDEPPELVIATLRSLAEQTSLAGRYEVLILDNNTKDPQRYRPVQQFCQRMGRPFRFFHFDQVAHAKAGALNLGLEEVDQRTTHIITVDADYQVERGFLKRVEELLQESDPSHLQFPQRYRQLGESNAALSNEYDQYFKAFARASQASGEMLLTGTMSVIRLKDLRQAGGWPTGSVTEDAALGLRLLSQGGSGQYVEETWGRGVIPTTLRDLSRQRHRWAAGNAQVLREALHRRQISPATLGQLLAWCQGSLLTFGLALLFSFSPATRGLATITFAVFLAIVILELGLHLATCSGSLSTRMKSLMFRLALLPEGCGGFLNGLLSNKISFIRTPKTLRVADSPQTLDIALAAVSFLLGPLLFLLVGPVALFASCFLSSIFLARIWCATALAGACSGEEETTLTPLSPQLPTPAQKKKAA
ncbi:MAG: glycosyltransferase family 2 protein [Verrucomicrobiota bacterium JB023]|nr:glycosyltransferase family 2 protein [Verrucomicrobiota bacterium JB023]